LHPTSIGIARPRPPWVPVKCKGADGYRRLPLSNSVAYRTADGIVLANWYFGTPLRTPNPAAPAVPGRLCRPASPVSQPVVSSTLAAWECGVAPSRTVEIARYTGVLEEYEVASSGDRFAPAAYAGLVAFVDGSDGSVWLHDSTPATRQTVRVCDGTASGVAVGSVGGVPVLAVARHSGKPDADIEIWDPSGGLGTAGRVAVLAVTGDQRNPHLAGEWVAFEDLSTGRSQVVVWQWTTGLVFLPHPSTSNQTLNDLGVISSAEVRVVFADDGDGSGGEFYQNCPERQACLDGMCLEACEAAVLDKVRCTSGAPTAVLASWTSRHLPLTRLQIS
jgi:hypothetical protein